MRAIEKNLILISYIFKCIILRKVLKGAGYVSLICQLTDTNKAKLFYLGLSSFDKIPQK